MLILIARSTRLAEEIACPACSRLLTNLRRGRRLTQLQSRPLHSTHVATSDSGIATPQAQDTERDNSDTAPPGSECKETGQAASGLKGLRSQSSSLRRRVDATHASASTLTILGQSSELPIRARFAPSPTGYLHLGSLRTALFNKLAACASKGGAFILRIEDTDQSRRVQDAEERLIKDLEWAGLSWDEGPDRGGPYGPYRQSERLALYHQHAQTLIDKDEAYRCFCSSEQLEAEKRSLHVSGLPTAYSGTCRLIDKSESSRRADMGEAHVVRFKGGERARPQFKDAIYGIIQKKDPEEDFVLLKSDGYPTYHLANVVDDYCMKITHVIRGEEWLISTPKHVALYHAFGWQPPTFAHLGLLVNPDGTKLSKRDNSANLSTYQEEQGIFPLALLSWLANLGSSFKSQKGPMPRTISQVADALTFKFTRGGIKLNFAKLHYFHNKYAHDLLYRPIPELAETETGLLHRHLVQPLLREIDAMGGRNSPDLTGLPAAWQTELELVPSLQSDESSRAAHVRRVLNTMRNNFDSPRSVLNKDPYLFWRVPTSLYRRSLAAFAPDRRVLDALDEATTGSRAATNWGGPDAKPVDLVRDALSSRDVHVDESSLHNVLRLVGAGAHDAASQSSHNMMIVLGRNEWRHRLDRLNDVLVEMLSS